MSKTVSVGNFASAIISCLEEYASLVSDDVKKAAQKGAAVVREEIKATAPRTDKAKLHYADTWTAKKTEEYAHKVVYTVYSPKRYMLAHLLENGHAKVGGGRVRAIPHIAPAAEKGIKKYEELIDKALRS